VNEYEWKLFAEAFPVRFKEMSKEELLEKYPDTRPKKMKKLRTGKKSLSHFNLLTVDNPDTVLRQQKRRKEFKLKKKLMKELNKNVK
jgi:hypothetical protein